MNVFHRANNGRFFYVAALRIICSLVAFAGSYVKSCFRRILGQFRGGVAYWRGGRVGKQGLAGVDSKQGSGAQDCIVRKSPALVGLLIRLPAYTERLSASGRNREENTESFEDIFHGQRLYRGGALEQRRGIGQFLVDAFRPGQSVLFMTTKAGR